MMKSPEKFNVLMPMKAHSERVPNKNLRDFCGKPLYTYMTETLLASSYVADVYINTDSPEIVQDVQKRFPQRVKIIDRPLELCGDFIYFNDILKYDLSQMDGNYFIQVHATTPLLKLATIQKAIETFLQSRDSDSLFGVTRLQTRLYNKDGKAINHRPHEMLRTQDLDPVYEENSNIYLFTRQAFLNKGRRIGEKPILFEIPKLEATDIDTEEDFILAERIYHVLNP